MNYILTAILCLILGLVWSNEGLSKPPVYFNNMVDSMIESENTGLPVLVIFTADWCKYCHIFINDIENNPQIIENTIVCYIDYDKERPLSKEYAVVSLPTSILIENKIEKQRMVGYRGISKFRQWLRQND